MHVARGRFITVEGIEGVGKSTHLDRVVRRIEAAGHRVVCTREPGGTPLAERIRDIVLQPTDEGVPPMTELCLMFAARAAHVENKIEPALAAGSWVVSDRFVDASRAYQGGGRGMPMARVETLADWVVGSCIPDVTLLLDAPVNVALERTRKRGAQDRLDTETYAFYERVRNSYLELAAAEPGRFVVIDASADLEQVRRDVDVAADRLLTIAGNKSH